MQWVCNWPEASSQTFALYQGETAEFEPIFKVNGKAVTNVSIFAVWYQTNGMDQAWWKLDGNVFAPSNDVGAVSYRFFVEARQQPTTNNQSPTPKIYRANGTLRMLPSPGYVPNAIAPPVVTLDFAALNVLNAPWLEDETDPTVPAWAKAENPPQTDISGKADKTEVAAAAQAATNYTDAVAADKADRTKTVVTEAVEEGDFWIDSSRGYVLARVDESETQYPTWAPGGHLVDGLPRLTFEGSWVYSMSEIGPQAALPMWANQSPSVNDTDLFKLHRVFALTNAVTNVYSVAYADDVASAVGAAAQASTNYTDAVVSNRLTKAQGDQLYRGVSDEYVYAPTGYGDFEWSGDRADVAGALNASNIQPTVGYQDGEYTEWNVAVEVGGLYYWGYAYDGESSPRVSFYFYADYWDESLGEWVYDSFTLYAERRATGYSMQTPVDTFAHQSALTRAVQALNTLSNNLLRGEYRRLRTNGTREYGSGWGFLQKPPESDFRRWRIRAPLCTVSGLDTPAGYANGFYRPDSAQQHGGAYIRNPLSLLAQYALSELKLTSTEGAAGSDSVQLAHFDFGAVRVSPTSEAAGYHLHWRLENLEMSPRTFRVSPVTNGLEAAQVYVAGAEKTVCFKSVDMPQAYYNGGSYYRLYSQPLRLGVAPGEYLATNTVPLKLYMVSADSNTSTYSNYGHSGEIIRELTVSLEFSTSQNADYYIPEGRVVTDATAGLFYDEVSRGTYRVACSNGCLFVEYLTDKDWRKEDIGE